MAKSLVGSSLRRFGAPIGALASLCLVIAAGSLAATPSPDPPPPAVAPEPPPVATATPEPVRQAPVRTSAPAVQRAAPPQAVGSSSPPASRATRAEAPAVKPKPTATKQPATVERVAAAARAPHDRSPVPLVALVTAEASFDRGLLTFAGLLLALVAVSGGLLLQIARRALAEGVA